MTPVLPHGSIKPPNWLIIVLWIVAIAGILFVQFGCSAWPRGHLDPQWMVIKSYKSGQRDMAERVLHDLKTPMTKEEVEFLLKGYLDLEDLNK